MTRRKQAFNIECSKLEERHTEGQTWWARVWITERRRVCVCVSVCGRASYLKGVRMSNLLRESVDSVVSSVDPQSRHHSQEFLVSAGVIPEHTGHTDLLMLL